MIEAPLAILAGGEGRRLGKTYKPLLQLGGKPLILHILESLANSFSRVIVIVHNDHQAEELSKIVGGRVCIVRDRLEIQTPLSGIYTAAHEFGKGVFAVTPVDTPFLRASSYERMLAKINGFEAALPLWPNGYLEPLIAIYRSESVLKVAPSVMAHRHRVLDLIEKLQSIKIPVEDVFEDPRLETLNINTWEDLLKAEAAYLQRLRAPPRHDDRR